MGQRQAPVQQQGPLLISMMGQRQPPPQPQVPLIISMMGQRQPAPPPQQPMIISMMGGYGQQQQSQQLPMIISMMGGYGGAAPQISYLGGQQAGGLSALRKPGAPQASAQSLSSMGRPQICGVPKQAPKPQSPMQPQRAPGQPQGQRSAAPQRGPPPRR
ncbi:proline-rich proteoglycan 2-like [Galendromus occidentalis]|uniref:Proline-rich proteoglycan 2-like n=1 Tax=Galendromus occidentalis TaxID=34638 RepID=A0AAJ7PA95_9ACAR|nr:proline-rich proteoglycan 2-like [Galendromus occidentalis]